MSNDNSEQKPGSGQPQAPNSIPIGSVGDDRAGNKPLNEVQPYQGPADPGSC